MTDRDRRRILTEWRRSGLSAAEFAPCVGVSPWTLYAWRRKLEAAAGSTGAGGFVELVAEPTSADVGTLAVELPRGITVRVGRDFDPQTLRRTVDALVVGHQA